MLKLFLLDFRYDRGLIEICYCCCVDVNRWILKAMPTCTRTVKH